MKTLIITSAILFFHVNLVSQNYIIASNTVDVQGLHFTKNKTTLNTLASAYLSFADEVTTKSNFEYRNFLRDSKKSNRTYLVGNKRYSKEELTKIFRKGARKSEDAKEFEVYLRKENPKLASLISQNEIEVLFHKFREGTLHAYLDSLPSSLILP